MKRKIRISLCITSDTHFLHHCCFSLFNRMKRESLSLFMCAIFNRIAGQNGQHTLIIYNLLLRILVYKTWESCPAQNRVRLIMMMKMNENVIDKYTSLSSQLWSLMQKQIPLFSRQKIIEWIISDTSRLPLFSVPFTCTSVVFSFNLLIHSSSRHSFHFMLFLLWFQGMKTHVRHEVNPRKSGSTTDLQVLASQTVPSSVNIISCLVLRRLPLLFDWFEGYLTLSPKIRSC